MARGRGQRAAAPLVPPPEPTPPPLLSNPLAPLIPTDEALLNSLVCGVAVEGIEYTQEMIDDLSRRSELLTIAKRRCEESSMQPCAECLALVQAVHLCIQCQRAMHAFCGANVGAEESFHRRCSTCERRGDAGNGGNARNPNPPAPRPPLAPRNNANNGGAEQVLISLSLYFSTAKHRQRGTPPRIKGASARENSGKTQPKLLESQRRQRSTLTTSRTYRSSKSTNDAATRTTSVTEDAAPSATDGVSVLGNGRGPTRTGIHKRADNDAKTKISVRGRTDRREAR